MDSTGQPTCDLGDAWMMSLCDSTSSDHDDIATNTTEQFWPDDRDCMEKMTSDALSTVSTRLPSKCNAGLDSNDILLHSLVACIEDLQGHVSFLLTQVKPMSDQPCAEAKCDFLKDHRRDGGRKTHELRRQAWEIKRLKATVRALSAKHSSVLKQTRHVASKCNDRHKRTLKVKATTPEKDPCALVVYQSTEPKALFHATHSKAPAHLGDLDYEKTACTMDDVISPKACTAHAGNCSQKEGMLAGEAGINAHTVSPESPLDAAVARELGQPGPTGRTVSRAHPSLGHEPLGDLPLEREAVHSLPPDHEYPFDLDNMLSEFGDIPRERTKSRQANFSVLSGAIDRSAMRPGKMRKQTFPGSALSG